MPDKPAFPFAALVTWLVIATSIATIVLLFFPDPPFALRFVVAGVVILGVGAVSVFYLGRRWEWTHLKRVVKKAESS